MPRCIMCGASMKEGPLYRINEKGRPGIWACKKHKANPDPDLVAVAELIHEANPNKRGR